jgi:hypothetical protein
MELSKQGVSAMPARQQQKTLCIQETTVGIIQNTNSTNGQEQPQVDPEMP